MPGLRDKAELLEIAKSNEFTDCLLAAMKRQQMQKWEYKHFPEVLPNQEIFANSVWAVFKRCLIEYYETRDEVYVGWNTEISVGFRVDRRTEEVVRDWCHHDVFDIGEKPGTKSYMNWILDLEITRGYVALDLGISEAAVTEDQFAQWLVPAFRYFEVICNNRGIQTTFYAGEDDDRDSYYDTLFIGVSIDKLPFL